MARPVPSQAMMVWCSYVWPSLACVLVALLVPFLVPLLLIVGVYRLWLVYRINYLCPHVQVAQQKDAMWFQSTDANLGIINTMWWINGKCDLEKLRNTLNERMTSATDSNGKFLYPKLRSSVKTVWHRYVWCPLGEIDMGDYVTLHEGTPKTQQEMDTLLGYLCSRPLSMDRAQWECILVNIGTPEDEKYVCVFRVHHAIGDGVALNTLMMTHFFDRNEVNIKATHQNHKGFGTKDQLMMIVKAILLTPALQINRLFKGFDRNALHGPTLSGHKLAAYSKKIDLNFIKKMKDAAHCTVNDILMACLASTFQEYFRRHCSVTPDQIMTSIPINLRKPKPGDHSLDNQFSVVFLGLPLKESGLLETLKETKRRMDVVKRSAEPLINSWTMSYVMSHMPSFASKFIFDMIGDQSSIVVSNVPGPQQQLTLNGQPLDKVVFWPPMRSKVGIAVSLLSYYGSLAMGVIVDKNLLSNPRVLVTLFEENVYALAKELGVGDDNIALDNGVSNSIIAKDIGVVDDKVTLNGLTNSVIAKEHGVANDKLIIENGVAESVFAKDPLVVDDKMSVSNGVAKSMLAKDLGVADNKGPLSNGVAISDC